MSGSLQKSMGEFGGTLRSDHAAQCAMRTMPRRELVVDRKRARIGLSTRSGGRLNTCQRDSYELQASTIAIAAVGITIAIPGLDFVVAGPTVFAEDWKKNRAADVHA